jgi:hypothetical protein
MRTSGHRGLSALRLIQRINREEDVDLGIPIRLQLRVAQLHAVRSPLNGLQKWKHDCTKGQMAVGGSLYAFLVLRPG